MGCFDVMVVRCVCVCVVWCCQCTAHHRDVIRAWVGGHVGIDGMGSMYRHVVVGGIPLFKHVTFLEHGSTSPGKGRRTGPVRHAKIKHPVDQATMVAQVLMHMDIHAQAPTDGQGRHMF